MDTELIPIAELLPHGPEVTVIDRLISHDEQRSVAVAVVGPTSLFFENGGLPAWTGIEHMAQTVAARAGFEARLRGAAPAIGFLLGTRAYVAHVPEFPDGSRLTIAVEPQWAEAGIAAFHCTIAMGAGEIVAEAIVTTYQPGAAEVAGPIDAGPPA